MQVKELEPMVLWQTALGSQGEERHSSISVKYKRLWLQKLKITFTTIIKGLWGCPSYIPTKRIRGSLVRGAHIIRSQRGNPLRSPLRKVWTLPPPPRPRNAQYDASLLVTHMQDTFKTLLRSEDLGVKTSLGVQRYVMSFVGRWNFILVLTCGWNRCCRWHYKLKKM